MPQQPRIIDKQELFDVYRQFRQWTKVAKYFHLSDSYLIKMRKRMGIFGSDEEKEITHEGRWRYPQTSNQKQTAKHLSFRKTITKEKLLSTYQQFKTWGKVAIYFGVSHAYIIRARKWLGIFEPTKTQGSNYGGINSSLYKGGIYTDKRGYVSVNRYHPENTKDYIVYQHILVMEKYLGRDLKPGELIHHIDGDKGNNDIKNLFLCDHSIHRKLESQLQNIGYQLIKTGIIVFNHLTGIYMLKEKQCPN